MRTNKSNAVCVVAINGASLTLVRLAYQGGLYTVERIGSHPLTTRVLFPAVVIILNLITLMVNLFAAEFLSACGLSLTDTSVINAYASPSGWDVIDTSVESLPAVITYPGERNVDLTEEELEINAARIESYYAGLHDGHVIEWSIDAATNHYHQSDDYTPDTVVDTIPYTPSPVAHVDLDTFDAEPHLPGTTLFGHDDVIRISEACHNRVNVVEVLPSLFTIDPLPLGDSRNVPTDDQMAELAKQLATEPSATWDITPTPEDEQAVETASKPVAKGLEKKANVVASRNAAIVADAKSGMSNKDIAAKYNLAPRTVQVIVKKGK